MTAQPIRTVALLHCQVFKDRGLDVALVKLIRKDKYAFVKVSVGVNLLWLVLYHRQDYRGLKHWDVVEYYK